MHINERYTKLCAEAAAYVVEKGVWTDGTVEDVVSLVMMFPEEMRKLVLKGIHPSPGSMMFQDFLMTHATGEEELFSYAVDREIVSDEEMVKTHVPNIRKLYSRIKNIDSMVKIMHGLEKSSTPLEDMAIAETMESVGKSFIRDVMGEREEDGRDRGVVIGGTTKPDPSLIEALKQEYDASGRLCTGTVCDMWMKLGPGEMGVVLAPPGVGKTTAMIDIGAGYVENNEGLVIHFSEEMYTPQIVKKYASRLTGSENPTEKILKGLYKGGSMKGALHVEAHPAGTSDIQFLSMRVREILKELKRDDLVAVIVDYIQILKCSGENRYSDINTNTIRFRSMMKTFGCRGWTGAQPQRNPSKDSRMAVGLPGMKLPVLGMADVGECWAIAQIADYMISINQTEDERDREDPVCRNHAAKIRIPLPDCPRIKTSKHSVDYVLCRFM